MSFWPSSDEFRAAVRWLKKHPFLGGGIAVAVVGAAAYYLFADEDDDELETRKGNGRSSGGDGTPAAGDLHVNVHGLSDGGGLGSAGKRSVGWSDDNGGPLAEVVSLPLAPKFTAPATGPSPPQPPESSAFASTAATSKAVGSASPGISPDHSPRSSVSFPSAESITAAVPPVVAESASNPTASLSTDIGKRVSAREAPRVQIKVKEVGPPSPLLRTVDGMPSYRSDSPLEALRAHGFSGNSASGIGVFPQGTDGAPTQVIDPHCRRQSVVITNGVISPEGSKDDSDWGHFASPDLPPASPPTVPIALPGGTGTSSSSVSSPAGPQGQAAKVRGNGNGNNNKHRHRPHHKGHK